MVYDWQGYRDVCYRMYITEKKALEEIMDYMKTVHNFSPSKRAFQTQFKRWNFPSKQNPAHKNHDLVARVKELWEKNTSQRDMLHTLNSEGFEIKERELMRVRAKNRWLLRVPNGMKAHGYTEALIDQPPSTEDSDFLALHPLQQEVYPQDSDVDMAPSPALPQTTRAVSPPLAPEVIQKRKERLEKLQAESEARYAARKRRRRTRGWAGLPADPPAPPRFPSETTIDESKTYLDLDNQRYREVREEFQAICEEAGIIKKTLAGDDVWRAAKDRLIAQSPHLDQVFNGNQNQYTKEQKGLALDVICTDVTKRMRTLERRMTIAEAKNALGINPEQARTIRNAFYHTLKADHFTSKLEAGEDHWKELKNQWIENSDILQLILAPGDADPQHQTKIKAMEVLCRDVMKRLRDDQTKRDPNRKSFPETEDPSDMTLMPPPAIKTEPTSRRPRVRAPPPTLPSQADSISTLASKALARTPVIDSTITDMQIDPSLLASSSNTSYIPTPSSPPIFHSPMPVYIRLSPLSTTSSQQTKLHLAKLSTPTIHELRSIITSKFNFSGMGIARIDGVANANTNGAFEGVGDAEVTWRIDTDDELDAYLNMMSGEDGKAVFVVTLG